jgi:hypothetical protein
MASHPAGSVEVFISVVSETLADGERWFASAHFHGTQGGERIAGVFDYSYTPFHTRQAAAEDALLRTTSRLRSMLGDGVAIVFATPRGHGAGDADSREASLTR